MRSEDWLTVALPAVAVTRLDELVREVAVAVAEARDLDAARVEVAFGEALSSEGFSLGSGVAIPHIELGELEATAVCLVVLQAPLAMPTVDGVDPDIFLFILSKADPHKHLLLLAHLARLFASRTLVDGLRRCSTAAELTALISAAELRHDTRRMPVQASLDVSRAMVVITLSGEKVIDTLLVELVDHGFGDACILEAQSFQEAAAREVPLFAGIRDIFGDPGGRRVLLVEATLEDAEGVVAATRRICEEHQVRDARVTVLPVHSQWSSTPPPEPSPAAGH